MISLIVRANSFYRNTCIPDQASSIFHIPIARVRVGFVTNFIRHTKKFNM